MVISIGQWRIRSWDVGDVEAIVKYANNRNVWVNLRDSFPHPYTITNALEWVFNAKDQKPETRFAIASIDEAIGGIGIAPQTDVYSRSAEIGYWLGEPFWGKGIATMAVKAMTEYTFDHFNVVRIYAKVFEWNQASARVLEKAGFKFEGCLRKSVTKVGQTIDELVYAIIK
ncbi:MAG TPA: GNAT family protein [Thermodesulfobacteriota bacterium]|nr:GNAT family protein [Thermodesulfobacteriota bacterium]